MEEEWKPDKFMTYQYVSPYSVIQFTVPGMADWSEEQWDSAGQYDLEQYVTEPKQYHLDESWENNE
jgi:hypothetical protein